MIEKYFLEGVRFKWQPPGSVIAAQDGAVVASGKAPTPLTYIGLSDKVAPHLMYTPISSYGLTMRMPIPYAWCDYAQGRIAQRPAAGQDILTGFMSGCPILRYSQGGFRVAHVGTVMDPAVNTRVKATARQLIMNSVNVTGFYPAAAWATDQIPLAQKHQGNPKVVALVTGSGEFYSILMLQDMHQLEEWVCGGIKQVPALNSTQLRLAMQ